MTKTSYLALAAAFGLLAGGATAPAYAADLGNGCCADLEERVAELEATTARKGNRVVSLKIYGQVNKALLFFDNGDDSDVFVVDNDFSTSRFGFQGTASISPGWTAGYNMEFDLFGDSNSNNVAVDDDEGNEDDLRIRKNELWVESERWGRVTIGQGSSAADGINEIVLGNSMIDSGISYGGNITVGGIAGLDQFADNLDGARIDRVRYDTPSVYGFILSASWGEDDVYDVALRFKKEFNSIRIAAGIAYQAADPDPNNLDEGDEAETISGSISVMHIPSGIYGAFAAGQTTLEDNDDAEPTFIYGQLGIEKRFLPYGATTVYGEYGLYEEFGDANGVGTIGSEATRYGFGITQTIDSAALDLYAQAQFWEFDADNGVGNDEDLTLVIVGTRIKF
jgi:predicted porin